MRYMITDKLTRQQSRAYESKEAAASVCQALNRQPGATGRYRVTPTPTGLADALDELEYHPHNTGGLSMLDEATMAYGSRYPDIDPLQRAFARARYAHMGSYRTKTNSFTDESWRTAMDAAHALAAALRRLPAADGAATP
jgi:hypothetical protein